VNFTSLLPEITLVHSSSMTSFGSADPYLFDGRAGRPEFFLDRSLECFRLLAEPFDAHEQTVGLTRGGR
jgi:hypothetical protein